MLYLTLNEGEYVVINENVRVHYEKPAGGRSFMIGIEAPRDVSILRGGLYEKMQSDKGVPLEETMAMSEQMKQEFVERRLKSGSRNAKRRWMKKEIV